MKVGGQYLSSTHNGAIWAVNFGYMKVYRHSGCIKVWMETDYPVAKVQ